MTSTSGGLDAGAADPDLDELLAMSIELATKAGRMLLDGQARARTMIETKSTRTDMVTEMDKASEAMITEAIRQRRPHDGILGEEGTAADGVTGLRWLVDPIDGTTNYLYEFPSWAVSIAAELDGTPVVGVVHDPVHDETFAAAAGRGATLNGLPLRVEGAPDLATALVGTGFSYDAANRRRQAEELTLVLPLVRDIRRAGSAATDMCWVAAGRLDAYYELGVQPWDVAAGTVVCREAGAVVDRLADQTIVAAPPHLFDALKAVLEAAKSPAPDG